ncbi:MAG: hypothetical protein AAGG01_05585 [Planctomycetota bacterium]
MRRRELPFVALPFVELLFAEVPLVEPVVEPPVADPPVVELPVVDLRLPEALFAWVLPAALLLDAEGWPPLPLVGLPPAARWFDDEVLVRPRLPELPVVERRVPLRPLELPVAELRCPEALFGWLPSAALWFDDDARVPLAVDELPDDELPVDEPSFVEPLVVGPRFAVPPFAGVPPVALEPDVEVRVLLLMGSLASAYSSYRRLRSRVGWSMGRL